MPEAVHIDFETASTSDLKQVGVYRYAEDPRTRVWGFCYRFDQNPVHTWMFGDPEPVLLLDWVRAGGRIVAHNAAFERTIWNWVLLRRYYPHWPALQIKQQDCTMARAQTLAMPAALGDVAKVMGAQYQKDDIGHALMMKMGKPRRIGKDGTITWWDDPKDIKYLMYTYCPLDVLAETALDDVLSPLDPSERELWELDQQCNDRGVPLDIPHAKRMIRLVVLAKKSADVEMRRLTNRKVSKVTKIADLSAWLRQRGFHVDGMQKGDIIDLITQAELLDDQQAKAAIQLRSEAAKTSTAKYGKMVAMACSDNRVRGLLAFNGARTGRDAGRLLQPQNLTRLDYETDGRAIDYLHMLLDTDLSDTEIVNTFELIYGTPLVWFAKALRSFIKAEKGKKLIGGDFANIEGRGNAWLANEEWKLESFRAFDRGEGPDLYKVAYSRSFGKQVEDVDKPGRQIGKVQELSLGYQGGVKALLKMARNNGVNIRLIVDAVYEAVSSEIWDTVAAKYEHAFDQSGLLEKAWTALKIVVTSWRRAHPNIVESWKDYGDAALDAVYRPGIMVPCAGGKVHYICYGAYLYCRLPSGRVMTYVNPYIVTEKREMIDKNGEPYEITVNSVRFYGVDSTTRRWFRQALYGGLQCENNTQGIARDVLKYAERVLTYMGYDIVLKVHDELLAEVYEEFGNPEEFAALMRLKPAWAADWPIEVQAWQGPRYVK